MNGMDNGRQSTPMNAALRLAIDTGGNIGLLGASSNTAAPAFLTTLGII